jgi:hypothetical protein
VLTGDSNRTVSTFVVVVLLVAIIAPAAFRTRSPKFVGPAAPDEAPEPVGIVTEAMKVWMTELAGIETRKKSRSGLVIV